MCVYVLWLYWLGCLVHFPCTTAIQSNPFPFVNNLCSGHTTCHSRTNAASNVSHISQLNAAALSPLHPKALYILRVQMQFSFQREQTEKPNPGNRTTSYSLHNITHYSTTC